MEKTLDEYYVIGKLQGVLPESRKFEFKAEDNEIYSGKISDDFNEDVHGLWQKFSGKRARTTIQYGKIKMISIALL